VTWTQPAFEAVAQLIGRRTGLVFGNRQDSAELGMRRAMARAKVGDPRGYVNLLAADERALDDLVNELTIGETFFFREPGQFQMIRRQVVPDIRRRRGPEHLLRAWCAACASGEEAYSLAILFDQECLQTHLLATDISSKALAKARLAVYGEWSLRGELGEAALPYLLPSGKQYRLTEKIRSRVAFEYMNLALDVYPALATGVWGMDLILCRNVLIYFDPATVREVAVRLYQTLTEGGWLITASSDPPLWDHAPFEVVSTDEGQFYRRPAGVPRGAGAVSQVSSLWNEKISFAKAEEETGFEGTEGPAPMAPPVDWPVPVPEQAVPIAVALEEARQALARGDYAQVLRITSDFREDSKAAALRVRALANLNVAQAEKSCAGALAQFPLAPELYYLHAVLLLDEGRDEEAIQAVRRALYLDRSLAIAHFTLGTLLRRQGDLEGARRAYRNARDLCAARPVHEVLALADGEPAGCLAEAAGVELLLLEPSPGEP
jgi:chemotaxis protein methyltransferase CheR